MNQFWKIVNDSTTANNLLSTDQVEVVDKHEYEIDIPLSSFMAEMLVFVSMSNDSTVKMPFTSATNTENMLINKISDSIIDFNLKKLGMKEELTFNKNMTLCKDDFNDLVSYMVSISYLKALYSIHRKVNFNEYLNIKSELSLLKIVEYSTLIITDTILKSLDKNWVKWAVIYNDNIRYETDMYQEETNTIIEVKTSYQDGEEESECNKIFALNMSMNKRYREILIFMKPFKVFVLQ